jgi:hypothetical protein
MICAAVILSASTSAQNFLRTSLPERLRLGSSFLALGQGSGRKAFKVR